MRHTRLLLLLFSLHFILPVHSQYYETGQSPSSYKWMQIETKHFKVIYPDFYRSRAERTAMLLESSIEAMDSIYIASGRRVPVILHGASIQSNGYVSWAPRRMELFPLPEQDNLPMDHIDQLAIHEATHVLQIQSLNRGFTKVLSSLFGEHINGAVAAYIPMWLLEGDAVFTETAFSESGRGRDPGFLKNMKALSLEGDRMYSYDKLIQGSYRDFVPNHYESGYLASLYIRNTYGPDPWRNVFNYTARAPYTVFPFNISMRRDAGLNKRRIYNATLDKMAEIWREDDKNSSYISYQPLTQNRRNEYISYRSPVHLGADTIIAVKTSLSRPPRFVMLMGASMEEKSLYTPGPVWLHHISGAAGKVVWSEIRPDVRWANRGFSVIRILDIRSGISKQLTMGTRYFSPDISPDGNLIIAASSSEDFRNSVVILDAATGNLIEDIDIPDNSFPQTPRWSDDGKKITLVALNEGGEAIVSYNLSKKEWSTLKSVSRENIRLATLQGDSLFYITSLNGTEDLHLSVGGNTPAAVTATRFGAGEFTIRGNEILFNEYHANGYSLTKAEIAILPDRVTNAVFIDFAAPALSQGEPISLPDTHSYLSKPYRKLTHLFNFHSWVPAWADPDMIASDPSTIRPGLTLLSQNSLSSLITTVGYEYDNGDHIFHAGVKWMGQWPVWESSLSWGGDPSVLSGTSSSDPEVLNKAISFRNDLYIPLSTSTGKWSQTWMPHLFSSYRNQYIYISERDIYDYGQFFLTGRFYFSNIHRSAYRDIYPRFAQVFDIRKTATPFDKELYGPITTIKTAVYFPGLLKNQGVRIRYEHDTQETAKFVNFNRANFPRGVENIISEKLDFFSVDYVFPLAYPDIRLGSIIYLPRLRGGLAYDYATGTGNQDIITRSYNPGKDVYRSASAEILADFHLLRMPFPISAGVRGTYLPDSGIGTIDFIFDINLFGLGLKKESY